MPRRCNSSLKTPSAPSRQTSIGTPAASGTRASFSESKTGSMINRCPSVMIRSRVLLPIPRILRIGLSITRAKLFPTTARRFSIIRSYASPLTTNRVRSSTPIRCHRSPAIVHSSRQTGHHDVLTNDLRRVSVCFDTRHYIVRTTTQRRSSSSDHDRHPPSSDHNRHLPSADHSRPPSRTTIDLHRADHKRPPSRADHNPRIERGPQSTSIARGPQSTPPCPNFGHRRTSRRRSYPRATVDLPRRRTRDLGAPTAPHGLTQRDHAEGRHAGGPLDDFGRTSS